MLPSQGKRRGFDPLLPLFRKSLLNLNLDACCLSWGALKPATERRVIPAGEWVDFSWLLPLDCPLARGDKKDFADSIAIGSRRARLAGFEFYLQFQATFHGRLQVAW